MSPPLAVLATLVLILLLPRRVPLWASFLGACLFLPLVAGKGIADSARLWRDAATSAETGIFVAICAGVFVLSSILTHGGHLRVLCDFATALIPSRRIGAAVMPALVGLIPMPGGAMVSAPLIDRALGDADVPAADRNLINYWFRHIWEVSWPLYPAVLVATRYLGEADNRFFLAQGSLTAVLAVAGFAMLLRKVPRGPRNGERLRPAPAKARVILPLVAMVLIPIVVGGGNDLTLSKDLVVAMAVFIAILLALATTTDPTGWAKVPFDRHIYSATALAFLVQVFGNLVRTVSGGSAMFGGDLPYWAFVLVTPFVIGFSTGATLTFATVTFPMIHDGAGVHAIGGPGGPDIVPWLVLAYAGGFVGYLTSPVHMCLVLSTRYFNSRLLPAYARLAGPLIAFLGAALGLFLLLGGRFSA